MKIVPAAAGDIKDSAEMLADAFARDENMTYFFGPETGGRRPLVRDFFDILMSARLALGMPVFVLRYGSRIGGLVMGYDTSWPEWLPEHARRWKALEARQPGLAERLARQDEAVLRARPDTPHYYLGVLGVHQSLRGKGAGAALIRHFCALSDADPLSTGTLIETGNPRNVGYYETFGFGVRSAETFDAATILTVLFRPKP